MAIQLCDSCNNGSRLHSLKREVEKAVSLSKGRFSQEDFLKVYKTLMEKGDTESQTAAAVLHAKWLAVIQTLEKSLEALTPKEG